MQSHLRITWISMGAALAVPILFMGRFSATAIIRSAIVFILCCAAVHDIECHRIENSLVATVAGLQIWLIVLMASINPGAAMQMVRSSFAGAAAVMAILLATAHLMERSTGAAGIGGGDVKLLGALGFCLGWEAGLAITGLACALMIVRQLVRPRGSAAPSAQAFAPYIALAAGIVLLRVI